MTLPLALHVASYSTFVISGQICGFNYCYLYVFYLTIFVSLTANCAKELQSEFGPHRYNILTKNCNHFSNSLVLSLLKKSIPSYVNRLAYIGGCVSCFIPSKMLEEAPVDDPGHSNSGYHVSASGSLGNSVAGTKAKQAFSGLGQTMRVSSPKVSESPRIDDLIDRRERARKAALARLSR